MIKKIFLSCCAALAVSGAVAETTIDSSKSAFHVGESIMMCGVVSEVTKFSKGTYLNFGARYPRQHIAVVVWESDEGRFNERFGGLGIFEGRQACARGTISDFRGALQLKVNNPQFLRLMK